VSSDVLERIVTRRRETIAELQKRTPLHVRRTRLPPARPDGRLERALRRRGGEPLRLIAEVKRASPSRGVLSVSLDPVATARMYEAGGATAVSLVTEPDFFQGDLDWVDSVRPQVKLPLLVKDFVFDSWQLVDAAARGADGILLIAAVLSDTQLRRLIGEARLLGLDCLVEVHDERELARAVRAGATVIGINNRDLRTFEVDLGTSLRLLPLVPPMVSAVAESGILGPADLAPLRGTRCDAVLVGEALLATPDPAAALRTLIGAARG